MGEKEQSARQWMNPRMEESKCAILLLLGLLIFPSHSRYYLVSQKKSWNEAQRYCREMYTDLPTIYSQEDNLKVFTVGKQANGFDSKDVAWIGLHDNISLWKWSEDKDVYSDINADFMTWFEDQPNNLGGSQYCILYLHEHLLIDGSCDDLNTFLCYDANKEPRYVFINTQLSWPAAQSYCRENHNDLASMRSKEDHDDIQHILQAKETKQSWIGLYRDPWAYWSDGNTSTFSNWGNNNPDNYRQSQFCAGMSLRTGQWNDRNCDQENVFICYKVMPPTWQTTLRMTIQTDADVTNAELQQQLLKQLHANNLFNEPTNFKIHIRNVEPHHETYENIKDGNVTDKTLY